MSRWHEVKANRRALAYIVFSVVVLALIVLGGILPARKQAVQMEEKTRQLETEIESQQILQPVYSLLVEKSRQKGKLPDEITEENSSRDSSSDMPLDIESVRLILAAMAGEAGIQERRFSPVPGSLSADSDLLLVEGRLRGENSALRTFLLDLSGMDSFFGIESLSARATPADPEFRMRIWMHVDDRERR